MTGVAKEISSKLRKARKDKKISQIELANLVNMPQSHISNIEKGKVNISVESLFEIARALELEPMLIPKRYVNAIKGFVLSKNNSVAQEPAFNLDEDENDRS